MINRTKKIIFTFIVLNILLLQNVVADILFYYSTAVLSAITATKKSHIYFTYEMLENKTVYSIKEDKTHIAVITYAGAGVQTREITVGSLEHINPSIQNFSIVDGVVYVDNGEYPFTITLIEKNVNEKYNLIKITLVDQNFYYRREYFDRVDAEEYLGITVESSDIEGHSILVGDLSKDKIYFSNNTFVSGDGLNKGTWSVVNNKLEHIWDHGSIEIHSFSARPNIGVTITNETYNATGTIIGYKNLSNFKFKTELITDKIILVYKDNQPNMCWIFNNDKTLKLEWSGGIVDLNANWQIDDDGTLKFITDNQDYQLWTVTDRDNTMYSYYNDWRYADGTQDDYTIRNFEFVQSCPSNSLVGN